MGYPQSMTLFADADLTVDERDDLEQHEEVIEQGLQTFVEVGTALLAIRDGRLYRMTHATFEEYCRERWGMVRRQADRLIQAAEVADNLRPFGLIPQTESQARPLTHLEPDQQREAWAKAVDTAPNGKVTAAHVQRVVDEYEEQAEEFAEDDAGYDWSEDEPEATAFDEPEIIYAERPEQIVVNGNRPHVTNNSGNNEWYTPADYVEAARLTLGRIELDPASSEIANEVVRADQFYTIDDDGLIQEWRGKVWMNPPYATDLVGKFATKLVHHYELGDVPEAIVLVNNATETQWFQSMAARAAAICFPAKRIRYWTPDGDSNSPLQGQAFLYFGQDSINFLENFSYFGLLVRVADSSATEL